MKLVFEINIVVIIKICKVFSSLPSLVPKHEIGLVRAYTPHILSEVYIFLGQTNHSIKIIDY